MVRCRRSFANNKGFSLMELIVAAGISIVVGGVAVVVLVMAVETYTRMVRQYEAESEMASAMLAVSSTLSSTQKMILSGNTGGSEGGTPHNQKTNRGAAGDGTSPNASYITQGHLLGSFDSTAIDGATNLVSYGITDVGLRSSVSALSAFGLFYQRPTDVSSGAIYIDKERTAAGGWVRVSPMNAGQSFGRFTYFGVTDIRTYEAATGGVVISNTSGDAALNRLHTVLSANFIFQMRYFTKGHVQDFFWCPQSNMNATCTARSALVNYYNISKNLKVVFANQEMVDYHYNNHTYLADRMFGKVYFFKFLPGQK